VIDIAWQQIRPQLGQLTVAIAVIAIAVALAAGMLLANDALRESFEASIDAIAGRAELRVTGAADGLIDESVLETISAAPGVSTAAPLLVQRLFLANDEATAVRLVGVDMLDDATIRTYTRGRSTHGALEDPLLFLAQPDSAMAPPALLTRLGIGIGDKVAVEAASGRLYLTVRAKLEGAGVGRAFGGSILLMDLYSAQTILGVEGRISQVDILIDGDATVEEVRTALRERLPSHYIVASLEDVRENLTSSFAGFQFMLDAIAALGLLLAALITGNRLSTIYEGRMWEMGVLRALGTSARQLVIDLLAEATIVSFIAVSLGLAAGVFLAQLIVHPVADVTALSLRHTLSVSSASPALLPLLIAGTAGIATGLLAALFPALRAVRRPPATVLSRSRTRDAIPTSRRRKRLQVYVTAAAVALVLLQFFVDVGVLAAVTIVLVIASAWLLVEPALGLVSQPLGEALGSAASLGVEDQGKVPSRAMGAAVVLMLGIAIVCWISGQRESFSTYVVDRLMATRQGDLVVDSEFNKLATGASQARLAQAVLDELREVPGVAAVGAAVVAKAPRSGRGVLAVDPVRLLDRRFGDWRLEPGADAHALEKAAAGDAVIVDANLSRNSGLRVGDVLTVATPSGPIERPIVGIVRTIPVSQEGDVVMSRRLFRDAWRDSTFTQAYVAVADGESAVRVRERIKERLKDHYRLRIMLPGELSGWFDKNVRQGFAFLDVLMIMTLAVAVFGSFDALAANVIERTREIGTMRALGLTSRDIAGMILAQALAIGLVGAGLGVLAGLSMTFAFVYGLIPGATGWRLEFYFRPDVALISMALGIAACLLGATLPALRAARLVPAEALRGE